MGTPRQYATASRRAPHGLADDPMRRRQRFPGSGDRAWRSGQTPAPWAAPSAPGGARKGSGLRQSTRAKQGDFHLDAGEDLCLTAGGAFSRLPASNTAYACVWTGVGSTDCPISSAPGGDLMRQRREAIRDTEGDGRVLRRRRTGQRRPCRRTRLDRVPFQCPGCIRKLSKQPVLKSVTPNSGCADVPVTLVGEKFATTGTNTVE